MSREDQRTSVRCYPDTVAQLRAIGRELLLAWADHGAERVWKRGDEPTADDVIRWLIAFRRKYQARRKKSVATYRARKRALKSAGLAAR